MFLNHIWLVPLFPAFGAAIMFFFGRKLQKATVNAVCVGAVVRQARRHSSPVSGRYWLPA